MARGKKGKKQGGGKQAAKLAQQLTRELKADIEKMPEIKKRFTGGRPTEIHGKIGTAKERNERRAENAKLRDAVKKKNFDDI